MYNILNKFGKIMILAVAICYFTENNVFVELTIIKKKSLMNSDKKKKKTLTMIKNSLFFLWNVSKNQYRYND